MTTLRTAAQRALEALEDARTFTGAWPTGSKAITNLRAALAQQDEPVAWLQPKTVGGYSRPDLGYETCSKDDYGAFPVYHAPPQRQPLTKEEIMRAFYAAEKTPMSIRHGLSVVEAARIVEKAHGIGEQP